MNVNGGMGRRGSDSRTLVQEQDRHKVSGVAF
jgi:hypothetical protein